MSEVEELRKQIEREAEAMALALTGFSEGGSKHAFIQSCYDRFGERHKELSGYVGEQESIETIANIISANVA